MSYINKLAELLDEKIKGKEYSPVGACGCHIKDIGSENEHNAEIIYTDLTEGGMKIEDVEAKIRAFADKHRNGKIGFCPPKEADRIIREHFGLLPADKTETVSAPVSNSDTIDLYSFF